MEKICAPAFSDHNNKLVWDTTGQDTNGLFSEVWAGKDKVSVDHAVDIALPIALFVIGVSGFEQQMSWNEGTIIPDRDAFHIVSTRPLSKVMLPDWSLNLTKELRSVKIAYEELQMYMSEMIKERNGEMNAINLTESELIGNIYIFLTVGHETTAHVLCLTFALLALYPDEQERLYQHILSILPDGPIPPSRRCSFLNTR